MPLNGLAELIIQPVIELVAQVLCYFTSLIIVPIFTLGSVYVEPSPHNKFILPKFGRIQRHGNKYIMEAELGALFGLIFWLTVGGVVLYFKTH